MPPRNKDNFWGVEVWTDEEEEIYEQARDSEGLLLIETVFIPFKCTTAENIYLFIISECHLRFFLLSNYLTHFWLK